MTTVEYVPAADRFDREVKRLLVSADDEFVPPLSGRDGTTQREGLAETGETPEADVDEAIESYHEQCMDQHLIAAHEDGELRGFMSFRTGYETPELDEYQPSNYISTIVVDPAYRRRGLARRMYEVILTEIPPSVRSPYVTTRTWSTNRSHLRLLEELQFENVETIPNDRGEGIDTVYYGIERSE